MKFLSKEQNSWKNGSSVWKKQTVEFPNLILVQAVKMGKESHSR